MCTVIFFLALVEYVVTALARNCVLSELLYSDDLLMMS